MTSVTLAAAVRADSNRLLSPSAISIAVVSLDAAESFAAVSISDAADAFVSTIAAVNQTPLTPSLPLLPSLL